MPSIYHTIASVLIGTEVACDSSVLVCRMRSHNVREVTIRAGEPMMSTDCLQISNKFFRVPMEIFENLNKAFEPSVIIVNYCTIIFFVWRKSSPVGQGPLIHEVSR